MKIRMKTSMAGTSFMRQIGDMIEVDDAEGARLIDAGFAEAVDGTPQAAAFAGPRERAVRAAPAKRPLG